jgi:two-component system, NtrC family, response regulator AtoC
MKILVLDDEPNMRISLAQFLALEKITCLGAPNIAAAREVLAHEIVQACIVDLRLSGETGLDFLSWLKKEGPEIPAIMISAHGGVEDAVQALKMGAVDYLVKPFEPDELVVRLNKAVQDNQRSSLVQLGKKDAIQAKTRWVGDSAPTMKAKTLAEKAALAPSTVLITGESGTGKEIAARYIHEHSAHAEGPFVAVNVAALPEQLLESELFGHEKGAFTGADARKPGIFELASGGTLFLDEIGDMPQHLQVKLLRAIQEKQITRLGAQQPIPVNIRLIAATNRNLEEEVSAGRFREDLYYRLNVIRILLPPLRERKEDIPLLVGHFIERVSKEVGKKIDGISSEALDALVNYSFPGNIRELENLIERAIILSDSVILQERDFTFFSLGAGASEGQEGASDGKKAASLGKAKQSEREAIVSTLKKQHGHRERSAQELGFTRRTLLNKIKEYDIKESEWKA